MEIARQKTESLARPAPSRAGRSGFISRAHWLFFLVLVLAIPVVGHADEPYGAVLDKCFTSGTASSNAVVETPDRTAAEEKLHNLETALKADAQKMNASPQIVAQTQTFSLYNGVVLTTLFFLAVALFIGRIADYFNKNHNPWALALFRVASYTDQVRSEEEAYSKFTKAFKTGLSALPGDILFGLNRSSESRTVAEFHTRALKQLRWMQTLVREVIGTTENSAQQQMLAELLRELNQLKEGARQPELLPVWQMTSALEGLLKQLTDKAHYITPSTLRTVGAAVKLLEDMCQPDVRADLLTNPPIRILAVDDDLISRRAVALALKKAFEKPDFAENAEGALTLAADNPYDVILLDVQMPGMDGFELCINIHETSPNRTTPVVFVTCMSDFNARAQSTLVGGTDLIGKPFLTFEITVKALTLAARGRLGGGEDFVLDETSSTDRGMISTEGSLTQGGATKPKGGDSAPTKEQLSNELAQAFLRRMSSHLSGLRELTQRLFQTKDEAARKEMLTDCYLRLRLLTTEADLVETHPALRLSVTLEGLVNKLLQDPKNCTLSALLTVATTVDLINDLCVAGVEPDMATNPPIHMLVADDDPVARRAIACALQMAFEKPQDADSGEAALASARERPFDVIFLDVQMPGMDGLTACSRIRETEANCTTPVVFVTNHKDFKTRTLSTISGGNDFMGKPFITAEITVKALAFALRGRLQKLKSTRLTAQFHSGEEQKKSDVVTSTS